jgi:hypothetical protein
MSVNPIPNLKAELFLVSNSPKYTIKVQKPEENVNLRRKVEGVVESQLQKSYI